MIGLIGRQEGGKMNAIENLIQINYFLVAIEFMAILFAIKEIIEIFSYFKKKFRIKIGSEEDKETLEERISTLEKHDKWQYNEISKISQGIDDIKDTLLKDNIEKKRKSILDFCSSLSNDQKQNSEAFNDIFRTYSEYEKILKDNKLENGQAEESIRFIREKYQEKLRNGEFNI